MCRAHCAVIFAIAQLSCFIEHVVERHRSIGLVYIVYILDEDLLRLSQIIVTKLINSRVETKNERKRKHYNVNKRDERCARVVSDTGNFDRGLKTILLDELHWLDAPERIKYKLGVTVYWCLHKRAAQYLKERSQV